MNVRVCAAVAIVLGAGTWPGMPSIAAEVTVNAPVVDPRAAADVSVTIGEGDPSATNGISVFPGSAARRLNATAASPEALTRSDTAALRRELPLLEGSSESLLEVAVSVRDDHDQPVIGEGAPVNQWTGMLGDAPATFTPPARDSDATPVDGWTSILD